MEGVPEVSVDLKVSFKNLNEDLSPDGERFWNTEMKISTAYKMVTMSFPEGKSLSSVIFIRDQDNDSGRHMTSLLNYT